jgi:threonine/homoserine/homoserine lactone efflux protein
MKKFILLISIFSFVFAFARSSIDKAEAEILRVLGNIIKFVFSILMLAASALLIYLGILYITGRTKIGEGTTNKAILFLVLGIVLLITSFFIPNLIKNFIESSIK